MCRTMEKIVRDIVTLRGGEEEAIEWLLSYALSLELSMQSVWLIAPQKPAMPVRDLYNRSPIKEKDE